MMIARHPHNETLARLTAGSDANVEVDLVARYLERLIPPQS